MTANFKPNDKVVCVDDKPGSAAHEYTFPGGYVSKGVVYHVTSVEEHEFIQGRFARVHLLGVPAISFKGRDVGWTPSRFRLVSEVQAENRAARRQHIGRKITP